MRILYFLIFISISAVLVCSQLARAKYAIFPPLFSEDVDFKQAIYIREFAYFLLFFSSCVIARKKMQSISILAVFLVGILSYAMKDILFVDGLEKFFYGLRVIVIIGSFYSIIDFFLEEENQTKINIILTIIQLSLIIYGFISIYQVASFPSSFGITFLGSRANGVYHNPITFSIAISAFSVALYYSSVNHKKIWIFYCLILCFTTGGRAGILVATVMLITVLIGDKLGKKSILPLILILPLIFQVISFSSISGRDATESGLNDGRLEVWEKVMQPIIQKGWSGVLFGIAVGEGTNASFRAEASVDSTVSDSTFIMMWRSFGLVGLGIYIMLFVLTIYRYKSRCLTIIVASFIYSIAQSFPEQNPAFIAIMVAYGLMVRQEYISNKTTR